MAILFTEGFDIYSAVTDIKTKWDSSSITDGSFDDARIQAVGGKSFSQLSGGPSGLITPDLGNSTTMIVGFGFKNVDRNGNFPLVELRDGTTVQVALRFNPTSGLLNVFSDTVLGEGTAVLAIDTWYYIEIKVLVNTTTGTVDVKVNETSDIALTSQDTQVSGSAQINRVAFIGATSSTKKNILDDIVILNDTGSINNDFMGDMKIETLRVNAAGNASDWATTPGVDGFIAVREGDNNSLIGSSTANDISQFTKEALLKLDTTLKAVVTNVSVKNSDASTHTIRDNMRVGGADYTGTSQTVNSTGYKVKQFIREADPSTSNAWANAAAVNGAEVGVEWLS